MSQDVPQIPPETLKNWQRLVDLVAKLADVPASLIMKTDNPDHSVLVTSEHPENPYPVGMEFRLSPKLYCQGVFEKDGELVVEDATCDPRWQDNEDMDHGMSFYIGLPLKWPDGAIFGTICVLDRDRNRRALLFREGLAQFARLVEQDLALLQEVYLRRALEAKLTETMEHLEQRVDDRTRALQDANTALRVLLLSVEDERRARDEEILSQVRSMVWPYFERLRHRIAQAEPERSYLDLAEQNLAQITSAMTDQLSAAFAIMTPTEIEVAQMVMAGKTTKDIAKALLRETSTIDFHRNNIRRKLGLEGRGSNLRSHLLAIS